MQIYVGTLWSRPHSHLLVSLVLGPTDDDNEGDEDAEENGQNVEETPSTHHEVANFVTEDAPLIFDVVDDLLRPVNEITQLVARRGSVNFVLELLFHLFSEHALKAIGNSQNSQDLKSLLKRSRILRTVKRLSSHC